MCVCVCVCDLLKSQNLFEKGCQWQSHSIASPSPPLLQIYEIRISRMRPIFFIKCPGLANTDLVWHLKHSVVSCVSGLISHCLPFMHSLLGSRLLMHRAREGWAGAWTEGIPLHDRQEERAPPSAHPHSLSGRGALCPGQAGVSLLLSPLTCLFLGSCSF